MTQLEPAALSAAAQSERTSRHVPARKQPIVTTLPPCSGERQSEAETELRGWSGFPSGSKTAPDTEVLWPQPERHGKLSMLTALHRSTRRWMSRNYYLNLFRRRLRSITAPVCRDKPLIVYQMGKVGSETLEASLRRNGFERPIHRVHLLVAENIEQTLRDVRSDQRTYFQRSRTNFNGLHLGREIQRDLHKHQWQVVTMVRDPVAQNVSSFFQIIDLLIPDFARRLSENSLSIAELMRLFCANYPPDSLFTRWFDDELGTAFKIDIYQQPFPHGQGFSRITRPQIDLLTIRLEDFDRVAPGSISDFLGFPMHKLHYRNQASEKPYYGLYLKFQAEGVFPRDYVDGVYESRYARHFYTEDELASFRARITVGE